MIGGDGEKLVGKVLILQFLVQARGRRDLNLPVYPNVLPLGCFHRRTDTITAASFVMFVLRAHKRSTWKRRMQICQHMLTVSWTFKGQSCEIPTSVLLLIDSFSGSLLKTVTAVLLIRLQNLTLVRGGKWQIWYFHFLLDKSYVTC